MKILIFLDHDIIIKNFLFSGALSTLSRASTCTIVVPSAPNPRVNQDLSFLDDQYRIKYIDINHKRVHSWRLLAFSRQLRPSFSSRLRRIRRFRRQSLGYKAAILLTALSIWPIDLLFRFWIATRLQRYPCHNLTHLVQQESPDLIFHPTVLDGYFVNDLLMLGKKYSIPVVFSMNSWDNATTKRCVVRNPDHLLVWGPQTKRFALQYLNAKESSVHCFGAPQLDHYLHCDSYERPLWFPDIKTPHSLVVLYAGANTLSDELKTIIELDQKLDAPAFAHVTLIYRPHPWGLGGKNGTSILDHKYKNLIIDPTTIEYLQSVRNGYNLISIPDPDNHKRLLYNIDVLISPLSTILLEAALLGKQIGVHNPVMPNNKTLLKCNPGFTHFDDFLAHPDVTILTSTNDILHFIQQATTRDNATSSDLQRFCSNFILSNHDTPWAERIPHMLQQISLDYHS